MLFSFFLLWLSVAISGPFLLLYCCMIHLGGKDLEVGSFFRLTLISRQAPRSTKREDLVYNCSSS